MTTGQQCMLQTMNREYHKWFSTHLYREMELLVFGHAGARVLVFPTRGGRFFDYENWGLVNALHHHIEQGWIQLFCVDSVDSESLYAFRRSPQERIARHLQYEAYILNEVLPFTREKNPNQFMTVHGCSLGAFHAINIAFRHPQFFGKVVALSGRYDLTVRIGSFRALFDNYYDETIYYNTPCHFVPNLRDPVILSHLRRMEIILAIGEHDAFLENNRQFSQVLWEKDISNRFEIWEGEAHRADYWSQMVVRYI